MSAEGVSAARSIACIGFLLLLVAAGCAHRRMHTTRQLEEGNDVFSGAVESPGHGVAPRLSLQWVHGFGGADVNLFAGGTPPIGRFGSVDAGGGARWYAGPQVSLEVHGMYQYTLPFGYSRVIPRVDLTTATTASRIFYFGTGLHGAVPIGESEAARTVPGVYHTLRFGLEPRLTDGSTLQIELTIPTFAATDIGVLPWAGSGLGAVPLAISGLQFGIGLNWF